MTNPFARLRMRVGPLREPCSRASLRFGESGGRTCPMSSMILESGGSKCRILRGLEAPGGPVEAGSDECLEDRVPGGLHVSYSTTSGGSWARQIPGT